MGRDQGRRESTLVCGLSNAELGGWNGSSPESRAQLAQHIRNSPPLYLPCRLEYLQEKQSRVSSELEKQALEKQIKEAEKELQDIK